MSGVGVPHPGAGTQVVHHDRLRDVKPGRVLLQVVDLAQPQIIRRSGLGQGGAAQ